MMFRLLAAIQPVLLPFGVYFPDLQIVSNKGHGLSALLLIVKYKHPDVL